MLSKIKIIIANDDKIFRKALISHFREIDKRIRVIGDVGNGIELLTLLEEKKPDVVLLDLEMPVMGGEEAFRHMVRRFPDVKVVILSRFATEQQVADLMSSGTKCCLGSGDVDSETLLDAIYAARANQPYFITSTSRALLYGLRSEKQVNAAYGRLSLTIREIEVLKEICKGSTGKEIAENLSVSPSTVEYHRINIYKKTCTSNLVSLVLYAVRMGIISANDMPVEQVTAQSLRKSHIASIKRKNREKQA
jgi:DNA-binding NarL/FixJ family response regulator